MDGGQENLVCFCAGEGGGILVVELLWCVACWFVLTEDRVVDVVAEVAERAADVLFQGREGRMQVLCVRLHFVAEVADAVERFDEMVRDAGERLFNSG